MKLCRRFNRTHVVLFFFFSNVIFLGYLLHSVHIKGDEPYRGQLQICIFSYEPATLGTNEVLEV